MTLNSHPHAKMNGIQGMAFKICGGRKAAQMTSPSDLVEPD